MSVMTTSGLCARVLRIRSKRPRQRQRHRDQPPPGREPHPREPAADPLLRRLEGACVGTPRTGPYDLGGRAPRFEATPIRCGVSPWREPPGDRDGPSRLKRQRRDLLEAVWRSPLRRTRPAPAGGRTIEIGLVVTPVLDAPTVERLGEDLERELARRYPAVRWTITATRDALVTAPAAPGRARRRGGGLRRPRRGGPAATNRHGQRATADRKGARQPRVAAGDESLPRVDRRWPPSPSSAPMSGGSSRRSTRPGSPSCAWRRSARAW